jgi:predicted O-linked N-acetylglucosamine transferase (SPINDLY family)
VGIKPERPSAAEQFAAALRHHRAGRLIEAERLYRQICAADGNHVGSWHRLGVLSHQLGRRDAADLIGRAIAIQPKFAEAHNDLGVVLGAQAKLNEATACFERAVTLKPDYAEARLNLANALQRLGKLDQAVTGYEQALAIDPKLGIAHYNLAAIRRQQGRIEEAVAHYRQAVALMPNFAEAHNNLGGALNELGEPEQAAPHCARALALRPNFAGAYNNLANALRELGRLDEALPYYERALAIDPQFVPAHYNRGVALRSKGRFADARASFSRALAHRADFLPAKFALCMAQLPILYADQSEVTQARVEYRRHLVALSEAVEQSKSPGDLAEVVGAHQPFYLAYQGNGDRDLQAVYGSLVCRIMAARFPAAALPGPPKADEPVRVGIVSGFFRHHSNWKVPIQGWLTQLDPQKFRIFGYHTGAQRDAETDAAAALCERFLHGPLSLDRWRRSILGDAPHILIYPELGMDPMCVRLAAQRLATVQCASWGHPETSGLPTIDYFLSSELMEPPDAKQHYTERLIRLPNLSIYYEPAGTEPTPIERTELGLRSAATVYWCSQSLFKYLPQFDSIFPRIARAVGNCQFTFIEFPGAADVTELFRRRLEQAFAAFGLHAAEHCVFLPRLDPARFVAAMGCCDIFLDSVVWSGCNSTLESLGRALPIVTMPGPLMRGRHSAAILMRMGIIDTIAETVDEYVSLAVRLAEDLPLRNELKARVAASKAVVYRDRACIAALEEFLDREGRRPTSARAGT